MRLPPAHAPPPPTPLDVPAVAPVVTLPESPPVWTGLVAIAALPPPKAVVQGLMAPVSKSPFTTRCPPAAGVFVGGATVGVRVGVFGGVVVGVRVGVLVRGGTVGVVAGVLVGPGSAVFVGGTGVLVADTGVGVPPAHVSG